MARSLPVENLLPHNVGSIINYHSVMSIPMGSSQLQSTTASDRQWRHRREIQFTGGTPPPRPTQGITPSAPRIARCKCWLQIARLAAASEALTRDLRNAPWVCKYVRSGHKKMSRRPITIKSKCNINKDNKIVFYNSRKSTMKYNKQKTKIIHPPLYKIR